MPEFRASGENIVEEIRKRWKPPRTYFHLQKGGHVAAVRKHSQNNYFSRFDISRFFFRVKKNMIIKALKSVGFSFLDANSIAYESVVHDGDGFSLPYGFVQSPILASLCLDKSTAGNFLRKLQRDVTLSVFVDDIILSHGNALEKLSLASHQLTTAFAGSGFPVSEAKCEICKERITSFNIHVSHLHLEVTGERMEQFDSDLRLNRENTEVTTGIINYVRSVNALQGAQLAEVLAK